MPQNRRSALMTPACPMRRAIVSLNAFIVSHELLSIVVIDIVRGWKLVLASEARPGCLDDASALNHSANDPITNQLLKVGLVLVAD